MDILAFFTINLIHYIELIIFKLIDLSKINYFF